MVGGIVIEVAEVAGKPDVLFVNVAERNPPSGRAHSPETCAIYVEKNATSDLIAYGDSLWWQGSDALWTPKANCKPDGSGQRGGVDYDIRIPRRGYSGIEHPIRRR